MSLGPAISLVIISKNSEEGLLRTLESVKGLVDEIVLVDTGSTDNTINKALESGAKIIREEWQNNFSRPRNVGIDAASSDWILILDTDEYLLKEDLAKIKLYIRDEKIGIYVFKQKSLKSDGSFNIVSSIRLFRNLPELRYKFAVHEMIPSSELARYNLGIKESEVQVLHSGYQTPEIYQQKEKRNLKILKKQLLKENNSQEEYFHYGIYYLRTNLNISNPNSIEKNIGNKLFNIYKKIIIQESFILNQDFFLFFSVFPDFLIKYSNSELLKEIFEQAVSFYPDSPFLYYKYAEAFYKAADYHKSIELLNICLSFNSNNYNPDLLIEPLILNELSLKALEKCYQQLKN